MELGLQGRTVIVTGASGGLGRRIAAGFAAEGADVVLTYREARSTAEQVAKEIGDRVLVVPYQMGVAGAAESLVETALGWTGRIDVLVNNAVWWGSATPAEGGTFETVSDADWVPVLRANVEGALRLARAVTPTMRRRGWGRMVHISSSLAVDGAAGSEYYAAAKAALHGFSRSAAFGLGADGDILSNVVMPGLTRTDTNVAIVDAAGDHYAALSPLRRLLDAQEVARPVVYLGSAANTGITGQVIPVTGGT